ncbi:MAG: hypothetical protein ACXVC1_03060 [Tumebacillaceae bacterium]|jgi:hypothetical protein
MWDKTTWGSVSYLLLGSYIGYVVFDYFVYRAGFRKRIPLHILITILLLALTIWFYS